MTYFYYKTSTQGNQVSEDNKKHWEHISDKKNWRITQLPNGYYQAECKIIDSEDSWKDITRRETIESCEAAIDASIEHYKKRLDFLKGPKVIKTF